MSLFATLYFVLFFADTDLCQFQTLSENKSIKHTSRVHNKLLKKFRFSDSDENESIDVDHKSEKVYLPEVPVSILKKRYIESNEKLEISPEPLKETHGSLFTTPNFQTVSISFDENLPSVIFEESNFEFLGLPENKLQSILESDLSKKSGSEPFLFIDEEEEEISFNIKGS